MIDFPRQIARQTGAGEGKAETRFDQVAAFRQRLRTGPVLGLFSKTEDPAFIEVMGHAGLDFVILDLEHGPNSIRSCQHLIRAAEVSGLMPIVRLREGDYESIGQALDLGAGGVQLTKITCVEEAERAVAQARFAPSGQRGVCRYVRAARYSAMPKGTYFGAENQPLVILQLEGARALANAASIMAVEGVDVLFVGPYDLSQSLGHIGQTNHPDVVAAMEGLAQDAALRGITTGTFVESAGEARRWRRAGVGYTCYSVDVGIFYDTCRRLVEDLRAS